jgi:hypothetical protein
MASEIGTTQKAFRVASSARTQGEENPMRKVFAVAAAALILACFGGWVASTTQARIASEVKSTSILELTQRAGDLPTAHYEDYSVVFTETDGGGW